nr:Uncharacterised protein [Salmonella sp. NCTC 7297]
MIMNDLRPINRYTNQELVLRKEGRPLFIDYDAIGLQTVVDSFAVGIALLQARHFLVKRETA